MSVPAEPSLRSVLAARPDHFWCSPGSLVAGWGTAAVFDPGTGPRRYTRAGRFLRDWSQANGQASTPALASFTFDPDVAGSIVIVAQQTAMRREGQWSVYSANGAAQAPPTPQWDAPGGDDEAVFIRRVQDALSAISSGSLSKVVMARSVEVRFADPLDRHAVLASLTSRYPQGHTFLLEGLMGSSPELLVERRASQVRSVALAGSVAIEAGGERLTASAKEAEEHRLTADWVESKLRAVAPGITRSAVEVVEFGPALHLATAFVGDLVSPVEVMDLVAALHPTPAVAGVPADEAMALIRQAEGAMRGRYGGPIGWFDPAGDGEWAIALRCAYLNGAHARLLAGAGVVAGSDPEAELAETTYKLETMQMALAGTGVAPLS
ncbi:MAG TPA: isochorismate synthase [Acidimicrobiia bacterium]